MRTLFSIYRSLRSPHPSRCSLDTFSHSRRRLLLSCSLIALDLSCPRSQSAAPDSRTQPCPRGTLIADQRRACAARPKGKYSRGRMALAPIRTREFSLPRGAGGQGHSQFYSSCFHVTNRFFVTFFTEESNVLFVFLLVLYAMLTLSLPPPST